MLQTSELTTFSPSELLQTLRNFTFLSDYSLALYTRPSGIVAQAGPSSTAVRHYLQHSYVETPAEAAMKNRPGPP